MWHVVQLQWYNRHVVWLRHLLVEMGYSDMVPDPAAIRGENTVGLVARPAARVEKVPATEQRRAVS